jgi:aryl-alcohol dehydrogenase-like predicted oxidoreductase
MSLGAVEQGVEQRTIGGTALPPIGLGCMSLSWAYGTPPSEEEGIALLHRAVDLGYRHFDTARLYGLGKNEALLARAFKGRWNEIFVASKMGIMVEPTRRYIDCKPETIRAEVEKSLTTLGTDHINLYYMHRRDFTVPIEDSVGAMAELIAEGKIGGIGLSEMSADTLRRAAATHPIAAVQTEYSPWTRNPELGVLDTTRELGTALVAFSPVARGVLANSLRDPATLAEKDIRRAMPRFSAFNWPRNLALVDGFNALAAQQGVTPAQLSLGWVLSRGGHVHVIPGTASIAHLEENFETGAWRPTADTISQIDALINQQTVAGTRYDAATQRAIDTEEFA